MSARIIGQQFVFGVPTETKPIRFPLVFERARYRFRNNHFALVFLKTKSGIRKFPIIDRGDHWEVELDMEQGRNERYVEVAYDAESTFSHLINLGNNL